MLRPPSWDAADMGENTEPTMEEKIADALSAAPDHIAASATVVDHDMTTVLREGSPDWICVPTPPGKPWPAPMCGDPTTIQWFKEVSQGKSPTIDRIGISYLLLGEAGADFNHIEAKQPPDGKDWYRVGPHVMFVFPESAGDITKGLGHDTTSGRLYVRPIPNAQPLMVVPIALANEKLETKPSDRS
jgi:hypothetical protein